MTTMTRSACTQVLSTTELLEAILVEVDDDHCQTLILAERVSSTFRACIRNSPRLQQRLFLKPLDTPDTPQQELKINPFLYHGYLGAVYKYGPNPSPRVPDRCLYHQIEFSTDYLEGLRRSLRDNAASPRLGMYLIRLLSELISVQTIGKVPGWVGKKVEWRASIKVKQQVFRELITLATSLQAMAERRWQD